MLHSIVQPIKNEKLLAAYINILDCLIKVLNYGLVNLEWYLRKELMMDRLEKLSVFIK